MRTRTTDLKRRQIDRKIVALHPLRELNPPGQGWLKAIRECLGMTAAQAGGRAGTSQQTWTRGEESETKGAISLNTLKRYAAALNCRVVYTLVPETTSLEELLLQRARTVAERIMARASSTMRLEDQEISSAERARQTDEMAQELVHDLKSSLWED